MIVAYIMLALGAYLLLACLGYTIVDDQQGSVRAWYDASIGQQPLFGLVFWTLWPVFVFLFARDRYRNRAV